MRDLRILDSESDPSLIYEWHKDIKAKYFVLVSSCTPLTRNENFVDFLLIERKKVYLVFLKSAHIIGIKMAICLLSGRLVQK